MTTEIHPKANFEAHALAAIFPMATPQVLAEIIEDMKAKGFNKDHPIVLLDGKVLEGRNRLYCAIEASVEPVFRDYNFATDGTAHEFVTRENMARRHLSPGQRAAVAASLLPYFQGETEAPTPAATPAAAPAETAAPTPTETPEPTEAPRAAVAAAAEATGASKTNVKNAKKLEKDAPDLYTKVQKGDMTIAAAMTALGERKASAETRAKKDKEKTERAAAVETIESTHGKEAEITKAIKAKKILKDHEDLLAFSTLDKQSAQKLIPLLAKGWRLAKVQKFLGGKLMPESSIEDLIGFAVASDSEPFEIKILGHWITVSKDEGTRSE